MSDDSEGPGAAPDQYGYRLEDQIGFLLRLAIQRHVVVFQSLLPFDLTPTQYAAVAKLAIEGPCSQNELGRRTAMDVATTKGVVDRLLTKGYIRREPDPVDRRRSILSLDESRGLDLRLFFASGLEISERTLAPLTKAEQRSFLRMLRKLA